MAEILVLLQYLRDHPREAGTFMIARSLKDRLRFSLPKLWKTMPNGESYKRHYDIASAMIHPSSIAIGPTIRPVSPDQVNIFVGAFFQPYVTAQEFQSQIAMSFEIVLLLNKWYKTTPSWPVEATELQILKKAILEDCRCLRDKAEKLDARLEGTVQFVKGKSPDQLEALWKKMNEGAL